ncbi:hypothetical protein [Pseudomonas sp.]|uniref:hypothetical protein n=1 Tax=Pseudomonas sp. TaxID=306 RepID=UPI002899FF44|nr:hypothetical protein [Pseudomonas sp.]
MSDSSSSASPGEKGLSLIEKLVEVKTLVLILCLVFYSDIWIVRNGIDAKAYTFGNLLDSAKEVPLLTVILFLASFSGLMVGLFPFLRKVIGLLRIYFTDEVTPSNSDLAHRKLCDWSFALVVLVLWDSGVGLLSEGPYKGLSIYLVDPISIDSAEAVVFRFTLLILFLGCLSFAISVDDPYPQD